MQIIYKDIIYYKLLNCCFEGISYSNSWQIFSNLSVFFFDYKTVHHSFWKKLLIYRSIKQYFSFTKTIESFNNERSELQRQEAIESANCVTKEDYNCIQLSTASIQDNVRTALINSGRIKRPIVCKKSRWDAVLVPLIIL